jgi:hypothetical protein
VSPSINEIFGAPGSEADEDFDFDMDKLLAGVDQSISESKRFSDDNGVSEQPEPSPEREPRPSPSEEPAETEVASEAPPDSGVLPEVEESGPEAGHPPDPLGFLSPERRNLLATLDEAMAGDPALRQRVLASLAEPIADAPPTPTLPEDIEEGTVAARLWHDQRATQAKLDELAEGQRKQNETFAQREAASAAQGAGAQLLAAYPNLSGDDIVTIAQKAGASGLAGRLATDAPDLQGAYYQALESTLWTTPDLRSKVLDPAAQAPVEPTPAETDKAEAPQRKRKLTALSSSASPVSAPPTPKSPLETRTDGRLTPDSRQRAVRELATQLNRANNEGGY